MLACNIAKYRTLTLIYMAIYFSHTIIATIESTAIFERSITYVGSATFANFLLLFIQKTLEHFAIFEGTAIFATLEAPQHFESSAITVGSATLHFFLSFFFLKWVQHLHNLKDPAIFESTANSATFVKILPCLQALQHFQTFTFFL